MLSQRLRGTVILLMILPIVTFCRTDKDTLNIGIGNINYIKAMDNTNGLHYLYFGIEQNDDFKNLSPLINNICAQKRISRRIFLSLGLEYYEYQIFPADHPDYTMELDLLTVYSQLLINVIDHSIFDIGIFWRLESLFYTQRLIPEYISNEKEKCYLYLCNPPIQNALLYSGGINMTVQLTKRIGIYFSVFGSKKSRTPGLRGGLLWKI